MNNSSSLYIHYNERFSFSTMAKAIAGYLGRYFKKIELDSTFPIKPVHDKNALPDAVIYVHGSINLCQSPELYHLRGRYATVAWTDTYADTAICKWLSPFEGGSHIVSSDFNRKGLRRVDVKTVFPRTFNSDIASRILAKNPQKKDYFAVIGCSGEMDRKNFSALRTLIKKIPLKVRAITDRKGPWETIKYASLSEEDKYMFLAEARFLIHLSKAEGFGLPPLEAMSVGTPVIYSDAPAHNSFSKGFPIRISRQKIVPIKSIRGCFANYHLIDINSAIEQIKRALDMGPEQYKNLQTACLARSRTYRPELVMEKFYRAYLCEK